MYETNKIYIIWRVTYKLVNIIVIAINGYTNPSTLTMFYSPEGNKVMKFAFTPGAGTERYQ